MEIQFKRFSLPKEAGTFRDYQDATYPLGTDYSTPDFELMHDEEEFRCALSDGATDAVFSKCWAELLVQGYAAQEWSEESISPHALAKTRQQWQSRVNVLELPWYTQEKAKLGAAAALVTLKITDSGRRWSALSIGDSCLYHVRKGRVIARLPELDPQDFSCVADLLSSNESELASEFERIKRVRTNDSWQIGDTFVLMSDALAQWFAQQIVDGTQEEAIELFEHLTTQKQFEKFVGKERSRTLGSGARALKDDDTTLILVKMKSAKHVKDVRVPRAKSIFVRHENNVESSREKQQPVPPKMMPWHNNNKSRLTDMNGRRMRLVVRDGGKLLLQATLVGLMFIGAVHVCEVVAKQDIAKISDGIVSGIVRTILGPNVDPIPRDSGSDPKVSGSDPSKSNPNVKTNPSVKTTETDQKGPRPDAKKKVAKDGPRSNSKTEVPSVGPRSDSKPIQV